MMILYAHEVLILNNKYIFQSIFEMVDIAQPDLKGFNVYIMCIHVYLLLSMNFFFSFQHCKFSS